MNTFFTSYCNHRHEIETGLPVGHECYVLPPEAILAEQQQDFERAAMLIAEAKPLRSHKGLHREPQSTTVPLSKVLHVEECVVELKACMKTQETALQDRDYYGTLHVNLLALARELEKRFGFERGKR